jgi:hypothetical protein
LSHAVLAKSGSQILGRNTTLRASRILMLILFTCLVATAWSQAQAGQKHQFIIFDVPGAADTAGISISPGGIVVGLYYDPINFATHGFLRARDGAITTFDAPGAGTGASQGTIAWEVNSVGAITGTYVDADNVTHSYLRAPDGAITEFDAPGAGTGVGQGTGAFGTSINAVGTMSGTYTDANNVYHGFVRAPDGTITAVDAPGAGTGPGQGTGFTSGAGITPAGAISGDYVDANNADHGLLRAPDGTITEFDVPGAASFGASSAISPKKAISGWYLDVTKVNHGFVRAPDGTITTFNAPGAGTGPGQGTLAICINPSDAITGQYIDAGGVNHSFLRGPDGRITTFDVPGAGAAAGQGTFAIANNAAGVITGYYVDTNGVAHGFLGSP